MSRGCTLAKKVSQVVSLNYRNALAKIDIVILFAVIFAIHVAIHVAIPQKVSRYVIAAILYRDINNPACTYKLIPPMYELKLIQHLIYDLILNVRNTHTHAHAHTRMRTRTHTHTHIHTHT